MIDKDVTVAIPTYNGANFIENAIKSVLIQNVKPAFINIIDDASTDRTVDVVREIQVKYPEIKLIINSINLGYQRNWNKCFETCNTKYLLILHQDDQLKYNAINTLKEFLLNNPEYALVGGYEDVKNRERAIISKNTQKSTYKYEKGQIYEFVKNHNSYITCSSVMFNIEKIRHVGYFDTDVIGTDEIYWPKVLAYYPIAILNKALIFRGRHSEQTEYKDFLRYEKDALSIYSKFIRIVDFEERLKYKKKLRILLRWKFSKSWISIAVYLAKQGEKFKSIKYLSKSFFINPLIIFYYPIIYKSFIKLIFYLVVIRKKN